MPALPSAALSLPTPPRNVAVTRYVTPLREGGSLPALVEGCDDGMYVLKFRGAGQGPRALVAELLAGELARAAGLRVPEIVLATLDPELARTEPDPEIQTLIRASGGLNLALDYLPGSVTFDPLAVVPDADEASAIVWFDALVTNIDRTPRNANLLLWHGHPWLIDHGAALYFHHDWRGAAERATQPFTPIREHVLLPFATRIAEADARLAPRLGDAVIDAIVATIPDEWLSAEPGSELGAVAADGDPDLPTTPDALRAAYAAWLKRRLQAPRAFAADAIEAQRHAVSPAEAAAAIEAERVQRAADRAARMAALRAGKAQGKP